MSPIEVENIDEVEAWEVTGGLMPPGRHVCEIDSAAEGESRNGHPQIELTLRVAEGPHLDASARDWVTVTQGSLGRVKQLFNAAGVKLPGGKISLPVGDLVGKRVGVVAVMGEKPSGEEKLDIAGYLEPGQVSSDVPGDTSDFDAGPSSATDDDEIPF